MNSITPWKFRSSDFLNIAPETALVLRENIAFVANAKLALWLKDAVKVYGYHVNGVFRADANQHPEFDTHTALLIDIKEIEKKCEHEPEYIVGKLATLPKVDIFQFESKSVCSKCGAKLKATWSEI